MVMDRRILVVGSGPAAIWAAIEAKKRDAAACVTVLSDEACEPYEKPPLSKAVLLGHARAQDAPIAGPGGLAAHGIALRMRTRCTAIERAGREIVLQSGERVPYDALAIATGSRVRELPVLPQGMARVHYLRTEADARALKAALAECKTLAIVGAGLIGLEVAASAAQLGIAVTMIEFAPRIMARACDEETGEIVLAAHRSRGVSFLLNNSVTEAAPQADGRLLLKINNGETLIADLVVVGAGVKPDDALASACGLAVADGIAVDTQCRTSDPAIFAAGDATRFPGPDGPVRLENWRHAQDQGAIAGRNAAGASEEYRPVPSFWSEQYDLYIQGMGWPASASAQRVRRPLPGNAALLLETVGGVVSYATGINAQRDLAAVRRLIERRIPVDPAALADPAQPFAAMLKAKT